jgi:hypothetical protein
LFLLLFSAGIASARQILQADQCTVGTGETIEGNLFVTCRSLTIEGTVEGDVVGAAATTTINGTIEGSVYLAGGQLDVFGTIAHDIHFGGLALHVQPEAELQESDVYSIALSTIIEAPVPGSVVAAGYELVLMGDIGGEVSFWGSALTIDAEISGDVDASVGDPRSAGVAELRAMLTPTGIELTDPGLYITENGMVNGQLTYSAPVEGEILADLPNEPTYQSSNTQTDLTTLTDSDNLGSSIASYAAQVLREFVTLALVGIIALLLAPRALQAPIPTLRYRLLSSLGVGLLAFILSFPIFFIIILLSVLVVLLLSLFQVLELTVVASLIVAVFDLSIIGLFYFVAFIITRVIVALALGRFVIWRLFGGDSSMRANIVSLLLGIFILSIFASLPIVGWLVSAVALFLGLGAILILLQEKLEKARTAPPVTTPADAIEARQTPPPIVEDGPREPGMENLPQGFQWWK